MKRLLCGSVVLAGSLVLVSCKGDPTSEFRGEPTRINAEPTSLFIDQGTDAPVTLTLVDDQGDPLEGTFEIGATGTGITVVKNENFLGTTVGAPLVSQTQFIVTAGDTPTPSSFTVTAGELSIDIPVAVTPTAIATAAFSNPTPAVNEAVSITAEGYTFQPDATISFAGTPAIVLGVAEDGSALTFLPAPGTTGPAEVQNVSINFLPTAALTLPTTAEMTVGELVPLTGTDAPGTAPALTVPAVGETSTFYDGGAYEYPAPLFGTTLPARLYSFTVPADGDYTFSIDWAGGVEDLGAYFFLSDGTTETGTPADAGGGGAHPEESTSTLTAGTYLMAVVNFSATIPAFISIQLTPEPPAE